VGGGGLVALGVVALGCCEPHTRYPGSPEWRGDRFANPEDWPQPDTGFWSVVRAFLGRGPVEPRGFEPPTIANDGALLRKNHGEVSLTWIGQSTVVLQAGGLTILTDPVFSERVLSLPRRAPPGVPIRSLPPIDAVLISHNHLDHLDEDSIRELGPTTQFVVPLGLAIWFQRRGLTRVIELDWWQSTLLADGRAKVTLVPAQHWSRRDLCDANRTLWGGYVIDAGDQRVYFAGDSGYPAAFREIGRRFPGIGYALLPIAPVEPREALRAAHLAPHEALRAFHELGARVLVPIHWGTFQQGDEPMDLPALLLRRAMADELTHLLQLAIGQTRFGGPPE
jgi:L-ascorbate metabolism protein UlaG (beta-lactamase superfamily)